MPDGAAPEKIQNFQPSSKTSREFRRALGSFGTGVTLITCQDHEGWLSIIANSFSSVSLDPPLILWCPAKSARRHDAFVAARNFSVHVLRDDQMELCRQGAMGGRDYSLGLWREDNRGVPILESALTRFDCVQHAAYAAGDHTIILGYVQRVVHSTEGHPLLFVQGDYGHFANAD